MDVYSARLQRVSSEGQKLKDIMLEIQRLRRLINLAEAEVRSRQQNSRPTRRNYLRLVLDTSVATSVNSH